MTEHPSTETPGQLKWATDERVRRYTNGEERVARATDVAAAYQALTSALAALQNCIPPRERDLPDTAWVRAARMEVDNAGLSVGNAVAYQRDRGREMMAANAPTPDAPP